MKLRSWLLGLSLLAGAAPVLGAPTIACAAEGPHAALVVDTGAEGGAYSFCVSLPEPQVTGLELIELAGEQFGLSYRFGYGGNAVCELAGVGSESDDCFDRYPDFWGYWHGNGSGGWTWASSGAGSEVVRDGDVEGWSWGRGTDAQSHPPPPATRFEDVCGYRPVTGGSKGSSEEPTEGSSSDPGSKKDRERDRDEPRDEPADAPAVAEPTGDPPPEDGADDPAVQNGGSDGAAGKNREQPRSPKKTLPPEERDATPIEVGELPVSASSETQGPPVAGLVGLAVAGGLVLASLLLARRRTDRG